MYAIDSLQCKDYYRVGCFSFRLLLTSMKINSNPIVDHRVQYINEEKSSYDMSLENSVNQDELNRCNLCINGREREREREAHGK
jgi:hypothetical protein